MTKNKLNHRTLLNNIINDYKIIKVYLSNGDLLSLLNSSGSLTSSDVHSLLSSFNNFKDNVNNPKIVKEVFILILNSGFTYEAVEPTVSQYFYNITTKEDLKIMIHFFLNCLELLPNQSLKKIILLYPCVIYVSDQLSDLDLKLACETLQSLIKKFKKKQEDERIKVLILLEDKEYKRNIFKHMSVVPEYWDIIPPISQGPSKSLIYFKEDNNGNIMYESVNDYLQTQFILLKEEYIKPLREAISIIKEEFFLKPLTLLDKYNMKLYKNVIIEDLYPSENGLVYRVNYDEKKGKMLEDDLRLPHGSLVCFTNNFFDSLYFGYVVENDSENLTESTLMVKFFVDPICEVIGDNKFIMIETRMMIEGNFLMRLQSLNTESLLYKEYFGFGSNVIKPTSFLDEWDLRNISSYADGEMDDSEHQVFVRGLQSNPALIKGLPGTGKTFVCLKMIRYMIENYVHKNMGPLLVMCYTEETFAELVKETVKTVGLENIIEISASSSNRTMSKCDIVNVRRQYLKKRHFLSKLSAQYFNNQNEIEIMEQNLTRKYREIINCDQRIVSVKKLISFMKHDHALYFLNNDFTEWLKDKDDLLSKTSSKIEGSIMDDSMDLTIFDKSKSLVYKIRTVKPISEEEYNEIVSLDVDFDVRLRLYGYWLQKYRNSFIEEYECEKVNYDNLNKERERIMIEEYLYIMKDRKVVLMRTSLSARYGTLLDKLGCQVVIMEEASKVPEYQVLASLSIHCQQLIMFGEDNSLSEKMEICQLYNVNLSLFDKLIKLNSKYFALKYTYRRTVISTSRQEQCGKVLKCGHTCTMVTHTKTFSHKGYTCNVTCKKQCKRSLHQCETYCFKEYECEKEVIVTLVCGHEKQILCFQNQYFVDCIEICKKALSCGHECLQICGDDCKCVKKMQRFLECGHSLEFYCGQDLLGYKCSKLCNKLMDCGHFCKKLCIEQCRCDELVECPLSCGHRKVLKCGVDVKNALCVIILEKQFACGHIVKYKCSEGLKVCNIERDHELHCGHFVKVKCREDPRNIICKNRCNVELNCGHCCDGACGECYLGRFHKKCNFRCNKYLNCGHFCKKDCHPGFCPPCQLPCAKYCKHSLCGSECGEACECKVCMLDCRKIIYCLKCKSFRKCPKICGVICSSFCQRCGNVKTKEMNSYYEMEPCKCKVKKDDLKPLLKVVGRKVVIKCQNCFEVLDSPYEGAVLLFYKKEYSALFQRLPSAHINKWSNFLHKIKKYPYYNHLNFEKLLENIKTVTVFIEDMPIFDKFYECYEEIEYICEKMSIKNKITKMEKYDAYFKKLVTYIFNWLNPFHRRFGRYEQYVYSVEKEKLQLISELYIFLNSINTAEYALVHKSGFLLLDKLPLLEFNNEIEYTEDTLKKLRKNLWNIKQSSTEEDKIVDRIINAKDIYKEFSLVTLSDKDKIKELKKLILRCHPDKNKSSKANEAVKILLAKKQSLS